MISSSFKLNKYVIAWCIETLIFEGEKKISLKILNFENCNELPINVCTSSTALGNWLKTFPNDGCYVFNSIQSSFLSKTKKKKRNWLRVHKMPQKNSKIHELRFQGNCLDHFFSYFFFFRFWKMENTKNCSKLTAIKWTILAQEFLNLGIFLSYVFQTVSSHLSN